MIRRYREVLLCGVALGALLPIGCGPSTTNESNLTQAGAAPSGSSGPTYKSYGDYAKQAAEKGAANRPAGKGKAAPKSEPKTPEEPPKSQ